MCAICHLPFTIYYRPYNGAPHSAAFCHAMHERVRKRAQSFSLLSKEDPNSKIGEKAHLFADSIIDETVSFFFRVLSVILRLSTTTSKPKMEGRFGRLLMTHHHHYFSFC